MTRKLLGINVAAVMVAFLLLIIFAFVTKASVKSAYWYDFLKDFSALFIVIGAAYLAYCFQQRQAFLFSLRELWTEIVEAKTRVNYYVKHMHPNERAYHKAYRSLSKAIDLTRGVYINVGESDANVGLYPFEPLHDVRKSLEAMNFVELETSQKQRYVDKVDQAWEALRFAFLKEFERPAAAYPIVEHFSRDPRRPRKQDTGSHDAH